MGMNNENAKSFEEMANEMDAAPETVAEATEPVTEDEGTAEVTETTDEANAPEGDNNPA